MTRSRAKDVLATLLLLASACGDDSGGGSATATDLHVGGLVSVQSSSGGMPSAASGAAVRATIDRNGDGSIGSGESWTTTTGADGTYTLSVPLEGSETVVLRFESAGGTNAPVFRTMRASGGADVTVNATIRELVTLSCDAGACTASGGAVTVTGLPTGATGSARVFNPATESDAFPGNFEDADGNLLRSGVFATFDMKNGSGGDLTTLATPAGIRVRMPRDTWDTIVDITPATTGQIDVPLYYFDEVAGTWVREGAGWLEDAVGGLVPVSALASLHDGTYGGDIYVVGQVSHFSTWNVDWPVESHGCVRGRVVDASSRPVVGATVTVRGVSYTGTSTPVTVGADGTFCIDAMRSEGPGEDVDGDGIAGESTTVAIRVVAGGKVYSLGERTMATTQASCSVGCADLGDLVLSEANRLTAGICTITGVVHDRGGAPVSGATVYAWDEAIPDSLFESLCLSGGDFVCSFIATSGVDGSFSLTAPILESTTLWGLATISSPPFEDTLVGQRTYSGCPSAPVTLTLDEGYRVVTASLGLTGSTISWTPAGYQAVTLSVTSGTGEPKWMIAATGSGFAGPVTYGSAPAGAEQYIPASGAPAALVSGDVITLSVSGTTAEGLTYYGSAESTVP